MSSAFDRAQRKPKARNIVITRKGRAILRAVARGTYQFKKYPKRNAGGRFI